jgi:hypothetical protein
MTYSLTVFDTAQAARSHRYEHGTGGWIFVDDGTGAAILFPPHMTPSNILTHPMTRGKAGELIGSM